LPNKLTEEDVGKLRTIYNSLQNMAGMKDDVKLKID